MKQSNKFWLITAILVLISISGYAIYLHVAGRGYQLRMNSSREWSDEITDKRQFAKKVVQCVTYQGNIYYAAKAEHFKDYNPDRGDMETYAEGYKYVGELREEDAGFYLEADQYFYLFYDSMAYCIYENNDKYLPDDMVKDLLYYDENKDSCAVYYYTRKANQRSGIVWFERDDDRFDYSLIRN